LRFPWVVVTNSPEDSHLPVSAHAGRTQYEAPGPVGPGARERSPARDYSPALMVTTTAPLVMVKL
jgi:hypothetical protein